MPDATVLEMVRERKVCLHCRAGFILDGFPRTVGQAESLKKLILDEGLSLTAAGKAVLNAAEGIDDTIATLKDDVNWVKGTTK